MLDNKKLKLHFQRFEFKYQLPLDIIEGIIPELLKYMGWDPYVKDLPNKFYTVSSLYYDSAGFGCYYDKIAGLRTRKKLRIRFYKSLLKPESPVFLEIKRKYDAVVVKDRLILSYQQAKELLLENKKPVLTFNEAQKGTLNEFLWLKNYNSMIPQIMVIYKRKPLISKVDPNFRVTIDFDLKTYPATWLFNNDDKRLVIPQGAILEVKFNNILPFWFHQIIQKYNLEQKPFSKYCNSLEMCFPALAAKNPLEVYQPQLIYL